MSPSCSWIHCLLRIWIRMLRASGSFCVDVHLCDGWDSDNQICIIVYADWEEDTWQKMGGRGCEPFHLKLARLSPRLCSFARHQFFFFFFCTLHFESFKFPNLFVLADAYWLWIHADFDYLHIDGSEANTEGFWWRQMKLDGIPWPLTCTF